MRRSARRGFALFAIVSLGVACSATASAQIARSTSRNTASHSDARTVLAAAPGAKVGDATAEVWSLLLPPLRGPALDVQVLAARILRLKSAAVDPIVGILTGEIPEPEVEYEVNPLAIERRTEILSTCLRGLPRSEVLAALAGRATPTSSTDLRLLVVRWLAVLGGRDALERTLSVASGLEPIQYQRAFVQAPIEQGLLSFLAEDPAHVRIIGKALDKGPDGVAPILARVIGTSRVPASAAILLRNLGRNPALDLEIVRGLETCGSLGQVAFESGAMSRVRAEMDSLDGDIRCAAITTLAHLGDSESAGVFVALLEHSDPLTALVARRALETISGGHKEPDAAAWSRWLERETAWLDSDFPVLVVALSDSDSGNVMATLDRIQDHPLHRHTIALAWQDQLTAVQPGRRVLFARLLGSLGSARAIPGLVAALDDSMGDVRRAASASLVQLTGLQLPDDSAAWKSLLAD